jgi:hypothetical protein
MKATTAWKLRLAESARKKELAVRMRVRGFSDELLVKEIRNLQHTVLLTLDRNGGFVAVDPDDIASVWVPALPPAFQQEAI